MTEELDEEQGGLPGFLSDPRGVLSRRWRWILGTWIVCSIGATVAVILMPVTYEATARLLFSSQRIREEFIASPVAETIDEQINAMVGQVLSRESIGEIVETHGLDEAFGPDASRVGVISEVRAAIRVSPERSISASRRAAARIFAVTFSWGEPKVAANVANDIVGRFTTAHAARRAQQVRLATDFLRGELEQAEAELRENSAKVTAFKERHRGELPSELATKLARLERLQQQRQSVALQISDAEARLMMLRNESSAVDSRTRLLSDLHARLVQEQTIHTEQHPNVLSIKRQIEDLEASLRSGVGAGTDLSLNPAARMVQRELVTLRGQLGTIDSDISGLDTQVAATPARQEELELLERKDEMLRETLATATRRYQEAELAESLEHAQQGIKLTTLDRAVPPAGPVLPKPVLAAGGVLASLLLGILVAAALELLDPVLLTTRELETLTGMRALGVMPRMR